jgi:hypothetical protein
MESSCESVHDTIEGHELTKKPLIRPSAITTESPQQPVQDQAPVCVNRLGLMLLLA